MHYSSVAVVNNSLEIHISHEIINSLFEDYALIETVLLKFINLFRVGRKIHSLISESEA